MTGNHLLRYAENRRTLYYIFWYIYEHAHHTSIPHFGIYMGLLVSILDLGKSSMLMRILDFCI